MDAKSFNFISSAEAEISLIPSLEDFGVLLDFEGEEDELNGSRDTTLSAIEGIDFDLDFDVDDVLAQLEKNFDQVQADDLLLLAESLPQFEGELPTMTKEKEELAAAKKSSFDCAPCGLCFTTSSNLQRHTRSKKHQSNCRSNSCVTTEQQQQQQLSVLQQTSPFSFEVTLVQPTTALPSAQTLDQMAGIEFLLEDFDEEMLFAETDEVVPVEKQEEKPKRKLKSRKAQTSTGKGVKKLFRCAHCPKVFTTASNLNRHENLHGNRKLHECLLCGKRFQQKEYLKKHQVVHERR